MTRSGRKVALLIYKRHVRETESCRTQVTEMEEQERLTMEFVKSLMDKSYTLVWVDYNDNLDNCRDTIQKCLEERSCESLWEKVDEWYGDAEWEAVREIVSKLKDECIRFHDFEERKWTSSFKNTKTKSGKKSMTETTLTR